MEIFVVVNYKKLIEKECGRPNPFKHKKICIELMHAGVLLFMLLTLYYGGLLFFIIKLQVSATWYLVLLPS